MYIGYIQGRKALGFSVIKDSSSNSELLAIIVFGYYIIFAPIPYNLDNFNVVETSQTGTSKVLEKESSMIVVSHQEDEIVDSPSVVSLISRGGDLGKSGPGARTKADAARNARKGSILVDAYSPHNIYCRYHQNCAPKSRLGLLFGRSNTPSTQLSREERRELNQQRTQPKIFDRNITIVSQDLQLTTLVDLSQKVSISDTKQTGKVQLLKKTISKKYYKHRKEFQNPDNSTITSKDQFFDAQVRHFQDSKVVRIGGIYLSKDHDPFDYSFYLNLETNQLISVREHGEYGNYAGPRILGEAEADRLLKHGVVGQDQARFKDISWIKHGMTAEDLMTHYNFSKKGKLNDDVMDSVEVAKQFSDIMKNQCSPSNDL